MTFTYELNNNGKFEYEGRKKVVTGFFNNTTDAKDGIVKTGLKRVEVFTIQTYVEGVTAPTIAFPRVSAFPVESEGITIRAAADTKGVFRAIGE
jgi:hypothetical protein